jgi:hypothetical protein
MILLFLVISAGAKESADWHAYVYTPAAREAYWDSVYSAKGLVSQAENLLQADGKSARLEFKKNGERPVVILRSRRQIGGYTVLKVTAQSGNPVLRISYADWFNDIRPEGDSGENIWYMPLITFPTAPLNSERFELYTIYAPGLYSHPMMQGGQCWAAIYLDTPGTSVDIDFIRIDMTTDISPYKGNFLCNDDLLNKLWYGSAYTLQTESCEPTGSLIQRLGQGAAIKLRNSNEVVLARSGADWKDYAFSFDCKIIKSMDRPSGVGWVFRSQDADNGYVCQIDLESRFTFKKRVNGAYYALKPASRLATPLRDGESHHIETVVHEGLFKTFLDGRMIDETRDETFKSGKIGLCQGKYELAWVDNILVKGQSGETLFAEDFSTDLKAWDYVQTGYYMGHGPKREKLIWNCDLTLGNRNTYYSTFEKKYVRDTILLFAEHQKEDGFIYGVLDPSDSENPPGFGHFECDEYSAWYVPLVADYFLFTADTSTALKVYPAVKKDLDYLWQQVEILTLKLFYQREETSKYSKILEKTNKGYNTFINLVIHYALESGIFLAEKLGYYADAELFRMRAAMLKDGINKNLWDVKKGHYILSLENKEYDVWPNGMALGMQFTTAEQSQSILQQYGDGCWHGKVELFSIRGKFFNHQDQAALDRIRNDTIQPNWPQAIKHWKGPRCTTWECMQLSEDGVGKGSTCHGDVALAYVLSESVLGVHPTDVGYQRFDAVPHPADLHWAKGEVPTPHGHIRFSWEKGTGKVLFKETLQSPPGTIATIGVPKTVTSNHWAIYVNNKWYVDSVQNKTMATVRSDENYVYLQNFAPGTWVVEMRKN